MDVEVTTFVNGMWRQNCYIISSPGGEALIVDPGSSAPNLAEMIESDGRRPLAVVNTHGHYDHIGAVADLMDRYAVPFYLHAADSKLVSRANLYRMLFEAPEPIRVPTITHNIADLPSTFPLGPFEIKWMPTPGHTDGSICLLLDGCIFSGDTLMKGATGRTDLPGGNRNHLVESLRALAALPGETVVYGGHGPTTTLAAEFAPGGRAWGLLQ